MRNPLFVVKLGGSIISSKREGTPTILKEQILRIAREIKSVRDKNFFDLILIHGAGSFGHEMAKKYKLWEGITKKSQYLPFSKTQSQTIFLNHTILEIFGSVGLPVIGINPSTI
ncbi:acetylglutamate kinase, partial [Candidatus Microgenomates bacterium]|nr:acetylglutamate kinase [Candidatus Microgenomates bacterium]